MSRKKIIVWVVILMIISIGSFFVWINNNNFLEKDTNDEIRLSQDKARQGKENDEFSVDIESLKTEDLSSEDERIIAELDDESKNEDVKEIIDDKNVIIENNKDNNGEAEVPEKILLKVPFVAQAPFGVWDEYHEEACEEASLIMLKYFLDGKNEITKKEVEAEIQKMIKFQIDKYGDYKDSSMEDVVQLAQDFYGIDNLKVVYNFSKNDLKKYLAKGSPIIVPTAGRLLNNPYFTPPGPLYHNLVLIGYDKDRIIVNDPGTKRGGNYKYDISILYNAIHNFSGDKKEIEKGKKAMIIVNN